MQKLKRISIVGLLGTLLGSFFLLQCKTQEFTVVKYDAIPYPDDNEITDERIALGRKLFFDKRLSKDESISCASCHLPELAFTDGKRVSEGVEGRQTERNAPSLLNAAYLPTVMYDAHLKSLELQVIVPIQEHVEMDMNMLDLMKRLQKDEEYQRLSKATYNRQLDPYVLTRAISTFERSLISQNSRFDKYMKGETAFSKSEINGWELFSEKLYCTECHTPPQFTTHQAINNGLYNTYTSDQGRFRIFNDSSDIGKFKVPSLRNCELTAPYMHDGSISSLDGVIQHYSSGGSNHPTKDNRIKSFHLSEKETKELVSFLKTLTDTSYMKDFR